jgi:hypothetical protein
MEPSNIATVLAAAMSLAGFRMVSSSLKLEMGQYLLTVLLLWTLTEQMRLTPR